MSDLINTASEQRLQEYLAHLTAVLGHADRKQRDTPINPHFSRLPMDLMFLGRRQSGYSEGG